MPASGRYRTPGNCGAIWPKPLPACRFAPEHLQPFIEETQTAKRQPALMREDLHGTALALKLEALLAQRRAQWFAMLPLRGVADASALEQESRASVRKGVVLLDLKRESDALYQGYLARVLKFALLGAAAIALLLAAALRSLRRAWEVLAPLAAAVIVTVAILIAGGDRLNIFHVVALLLVIGVGSNYNTLFFERRNMANASPERTVTSLLFCNLSTVIGFGVIGFASTPVLSAIGSTVAIGAFSQLGLRRYPHCPLVPLKCTNREGRQGRQGRQVKTGAGRRG